VFDDNTLLRAVVAREVSLKVKEAKQDALNVCLLLLLVVAVVLFLLPRNGSSLLEHTM